jgi:Rrf2 family protein
MRLTTKSRYGTRLLIDIAVHEDDGWVNTTEIAKRQNISQKYIEKLISGLRRNGLVQSKRGPFGGHKLAKAAHEITVGDVVRVLEESTVADLPSESVVTAESADSSEILLQHIWVEANNVLMGALDSHRLSDLIARRS